MLTKNVMIAQSHSNVPVSHDDEHNTGTMDLTSAQLNGVQPVIMFTAQLPQRQMSLKKTTHYFKEPLHMNTYDMIPTPSTSLKIPEIMNMQMFSFHHFNC